ncbi:MAG: hypothetical protein NZ930_03465 [Candidatus Bipolaricaulota bacterium]|nr:hypothetical protein [Candidatus Bipolaricaulota bacterium]MDW8031488.1 hypothetical protein [Candidatus Bipolaricaulota bacterium]
MGAPEWHKAGVDGRGVKVSFIDTGFDGYERLLGRELPPRERVTARSFRSYRQMADPEFPGEHGVAVSEVITDIAPGIHLYLATFDTDVEFRQAVDRLTWKDRATNEAGFSLERRFVLDPSSSRSRALAQIPRRSQTRIFYPRHHTAIESARLPPQGNRTTPTSLMRAAL